MHALGIESVRDTVGSGPGVVLWSYREPVGSAGVLVANPFAEWAETAPTVLYRRCFNIVRAPAFAFPLDRFGRVAATFKVVVFHDPEIVQDMLTVLPEVAKTCLGHGARLVLVSEWRRYLDRCADALDVLSEALPVIRIGADGSVQKNSA